VTAVIIFYGVAARASNSAKPMPTRRIMVMAKIVSHARVGLILTPINVDGRLFVVVSGQRLFVIVDVRANHHVVIVGESLT